MVLISENPNNPFMALKAAHPSVTIEFNPRDPSMLISGLMSGQVCSWDIRTGNTPSQISHPQFSHRYIDPIKKKKNHHSKIKKSKLKKYHKTKNSIIIKKKQTTFFQCNHYEFKINLHLLITYSQRTSQLCTLDKFKNQHRIFFSINRWNNKLVGYKKFTSTN